MHLHKQKIMIIERHKATQKCLDVFFEKFKYAVTLAESPQTAQRTLARIKPAVILCDLDADEKAALQLCKTIREKTELAVTPFIFLTSQRHPEIRIAGYRSGADAFISKPISFRLLLSRVESLSWRTAKICESKYAPNGALKVNHTTGNNMTMAGALDFLSIIELLQFFHYSKKSGVVSCTGHIAHGKIIIENGEIIYCEADGLYGEQAVRKLAGLLAGRFEVSIDCNHKKIKNISTPTMKLILLCCTETEIRTNHQYAPAA